MSSTSGDPVVHKVAPVMAHHSTGMTKQLKADPIRRENSAFAISIDLNLEQWADEPSCLKLIESNVSN